MLPPRSAENSVLPPLAAGRVFGMPFKRKRKLLGAALGSGGAKGLAHLGVMQALEEDEELMSEFEAAYFNALTALLEIPAVSEMMIGETSSSVE